jgi:hypothetical protein
MDMTQKICVDLCSGLGGFSQAFVDDPNWFVVRIDITRKLGVNIIADVKNLPLKENLCPDVLLMSPPCERFSLANYRWPQIGIRNAMEIVGACLEAVAYLKPLYWLLENPKGRLRWFMEIRPIATVNLGDYGYRTIKPTDLWGNLPLPLVGSHRKDNGGIQFNQGPRSSSKRAMLPLKFSQTIKRAVENSCTPINLESSG